MFKVIPLTLFLSVNCFACDDSIKELVKSSFGDNYTHLTCKINPVSTHETIVAFASNPKIDNNQSTINDAIILLVSNNKIANKIIEEKMLYSDAIYLDDIKIDTAAYNLSANTRAFGIRYSFSGSSRANPFNDEFMNLYIKGNNYKLINILRAVTTHSFSGEWDGTNCDGYYDESNYYLNMSPRKTNGFPDIFITKKSRHRQIIKVKDDCNEIITNSTTKKQKIIFNGSTYVLPEHLVSSSIN